VQTICQLAGFGFRQAALTLTLALLGVLVILSWAPVLFTICVTGECSTRNGVRAKSEPREVVHTNAQSTWCASTSGSCWKVRSAWPWLTIQLGMKQALKLGFFCEALTGKVAWHNKVSDILPAFGACKCSRPS
jgi:hypothetical protein